MKNLFASRVTTCDISVAALPQKEIKEIKEFNEADLILNIFNIVKIFKLFIRIAQPKLILHFEFYILNF